MLKKIVSFGFASTALSAALLAGPSLNFSQVSAASANPVVISCPGGGTPSCVPATDGTRGGVFCTCGG
jgi:hypothetical protein